MHISRKLLTVIFFICSAVLYNFASALEYPFHGQVTGDDINIRTDATINSAIITTVCRGEVLEVISGPHDWYKIRLPVQAPSFIRRDLTAPVDEKTAKVIKSSVNIRLGPDEKTAIVGKSGQGEVINIVGEKGNWYKIRPVHNSFGWVHKQFIQPIEPKPPKLEKPLPQVKNPVLEDKSSGDIVVVGRVEAYGKVINRKASHKLVTVDKVYLLKGSADKLNPLVYHTVRATGKLIPDKTDKFPVIEISKVEILN